MARQSTTPVQFNKSTRKDSCVTMTSGRAGVVVPVGYAPLLPGDSASGRVGIDIQLAEMPKPLLNAVTANIQAWFVPHEAHPRFSGRDEVQHAFTGDVIKSLGAVDRDPPLFFSSAHPGNLAHEFYTTLGIHAANASGASEPRFNQTLVDAYNLIWNFRAAAHSSRIQRRLYAHEDHPSAAALAPAFWPSSRFASVVPDYERALVVGALDLDVIAGRIPVGGIGRKVGVTPTIRTDQTVWDYAADDVDPGTQDIYVKSVAIGNEGNSLLIETTASGTPRLFAEMANTDVTVSLADIDKARTTQAFAKLRTAYAGNDATGFDNDDTIVSLLMQGLRVPADQFKRPWLLDSKRVPVGFAERFATDAANLDASVTQGRASAQLSINVPVTDFGGVILYTVEILPERIDERMSDEWLYCTKPDDLPNALRDVQRIEPVDLVLNRRVDAKHSEPAGLYGFEPMNNKWNRDFTRLGGAFFNAVPGAGFTENRANIWQTEIVDPDYGVTHHIAPQPFPHDVFSDTLADAFEVVARHSLTIVGLTQIGDVLAESNDDYAAIEGAGV